MIGKLLSRLAEWLIDRMEILVWIILAASVVSLVHAMYRDYHYKPTIVCYKGFSYNQNSEGVLIARSFKGRYTRCEVTK